MRKPLLATKSVTLVHCIRQGTGQHQLHHGAVWRELPRGGRSRYRRTVRCRLRLCPEKRSEICIFPGHSTAAPQSTAESPLNAASTFLDPAAFKAADEAARACHWTLAPEDKVTLPSGHVGTVTSVQDNRDGAARTGTWR